MEEQRESILECGSAATREPVPRHALVETSIRVVVGKQPLLRTLDGRVLRLQRARRVLADDGQVTATRRCHAAHPGGVVKATTLAELRAARDRARDAYDAALVALNAANEAYMVAARAVAVAEAEARRAPS